MFAGGFDLEAAEAVAAGRSVYGVRVLTSTLEEVYLELVGDEVVENNILSSRLALAIQDKANFELNDLRLRIKLEGKDSKSRELGESMRNVTFK